MIFLAYLNFTILLLLGLLHFYWAFGGKWAFEKALPTNEEGKKLMNPKTMDSIVVGFGLTLFALFHLVRTEIVLMDIPSWLTNSGLWVITSIFILRSIGDFKYVGFSKKVRETEFALRDTKFYSPLCLVIGMIALILEILI